MDSTPEPSFSVKYPDLPARRHWAYWPIVIVAGGLALACVGAFVVDAVAKGTTGPAAVVGDFFDALADKDVDGALEYVAANAVPAGDAATFIDSRAVASDWRVRSIGDPRYPDDETDGSDPSEAVVDFTIDDRGSTAEGSVLLERGDDTGWLLSNPFVLVKLPDSPLDYVQLNGFTPPRQALDNETDSAGDVELLPGVYRFYRDRPGTFTIGRHRPVAVVPHDSFDSFGPDDDPPVVDIGGVSPGPKLVKAAKKLLVADLDRCAAARKLDPEGCPFGFDTLVEYRGRSVSRIDDVGWKVERYPSIDLRPPRTEGDDAARGAGFSVVSGKPGRIRLSGKGFIDGDTKRRFTIHCDIDTRGYVVDVDSRGRPVFERDPDAYSAEPRCTDGGGS